MAHDVFCLFDYDVHYMPIKGFKYIYWGYGLNGQLILPIKCQKIVKQPIILSRDQGNVLKLLVLSHQLKIIQFSII